MSYRVHELFYSIQGEGLNAGRAAVFCRFSGCNLWDGRRESRAAAPCAFCDTDFAGSTNYETAASLVCEIRRLWPQPDPAHALCVLTGGEPALQVDEPLLTLLHEAGFFVAIETNGSLPLPKGLDWITVSPKPGVALAVSAGDELKLLYPYRQDPADFLGLSFRHFLLQPIDEGSGPLAKAPETLAYCLAHPPWRLGVQLHKLLGVQ